MSHKETESTKTGLSIRSRAPAATTPAVRRVMQIIGRREPLSEKQLRSLLHRAGLRFRKTTRPVADLRCVADIVFMRARVCVFVDGCFWHGCSTHFKLPLSHSDWWQEKIADNQARDKRQTQALEARGWLVVRVWEHEDPVQTAGRVRRTVLSQPLLKAQVTHASPRPIPRARSTS